MGRAGRAGDHAGLEPGASVTDGAGGLAIMLAWTAAALLLGYLRLARADA